MVLKLERWHFYLVWKLPRVALHVHFKIHLWCLWMEKYLSSGTLLPLYSWILNIHKRTELSKITWVRITWVRIATAKHMLWSIKYEIWNIRLMKNIKCRFSRWNILPEKPRNAINKLTVTREAFRSLRALLLKKSYGKLQDLEIWGSDSRSILCCVEVFQGSPAHINVGGILTLIDDQLLYISWKIIVNAALSKIVENSVWLGGASLSQKLNVNVRV